MAVNAKPLPPAAPVKKLEPAEVPPLATGLATVMVAAPAVAISAAEITACTWVLETKVVVRGLPLNCTTAAGSKFWPFTTRVKPAPPTMAELGFKLAITGDCAVGVGGAGGVGSGVAGDVAVDTGLTKVPPRRTIWPWSVLNARPFWPQRISFFGFPTTFGTVMDPIRVKWVMSNAWIVTPPEPNCDVRKNATFRLESGTMIPEAWNTATGKPLTGSTTWPSSE